MSPAIIDRELPAALQLRGRIEPDSIVSAVCMEMNAGREDLMKKGYRGSGRGILMELLYRYGRMKQPETGTMPGIDHCAVSIGRKRFQMMMESRISQGYRLTPER